MDRWDAEAACSQAELLAEIGRLQRENQLLRDENQRLQDDQAAWEEWKEAMTTAAAERLQRGRP